MREFSAQMNNQPPAVLALRGRLIVSCQATAGDPTYGPHFMAAFARAAQLGGAAGIRASGPDDIRAIKAATGLPVIGIQKAPGPDGRTLITPSLELARPLVAAGADIVALDATDRPRPGGLTAAQLIARLRAELRVPIMADVEWPAEAFAAVDAGADLVAPTLSVYHLPDYTPDIELVRTLARLPVPVIAEGNFWTPEQVRAAFDAGAWAVVIGSAITRPWLITQRFVEATPDQGEG
jgi:putative N-acetylmannosamine-6-phosphate epimerase